MRFACCLILFTGLCHAQLPDYYKKVNRVTWIVENIDKVRPAWEKFGLTGIREYTNIQLTGHFRGQPITIYAWQITGHIGNLTIDMIQPAEGQINAFTNFLSRHGDGIFSIVHEVSSRQELEREIQRMKGKQVAVLQQVTMPGGATFTYFDTEPGGKFALGLVRGPGLGNASTQAAVSHFGAVVWDLEAVSSYWTKLGFPPIPIQHATPREDSRYRGNPLTLAFDVGFQRHTQFRLEWISPPAAPQNIYADFLNKHKREGFQHIGVEIEDLPKSIANYEKSGYKVHQFGAWGEVGKPNSGQYAYMDTDSAGGVSVELVKRY